MRLLVLVATSLAAFVATLDNTVVAVALVDLQADLDAGVSDLQGVVTAYTVALAALLLTGGTLADVVGARRIFLAGLAMFAAASAACALAGSPGALVAARALQGVGAALLLPGALAVLAAAYADPHARTRAVGIWSATGAAALAVGPLVGGVLVAWSSWRAVFWVNVPLCAVVALVALGAPNARRPGERRLDLPGQVLAAVALGSATYAVVLAGRDGLEPPVAVAVALAAAAGGGFAVVERRARDPLLPLPLLRERPFVGATATAFAASLAVFVLLVFLSLFLQLVQQRDALPTALRLLPLTAGLVLVAPLAARWAATRGPRHPATLGLALAALALGFLAARLTVELPDAVLLLALAVAGVGIGLATAPAVAAALDAVESRAGLAAASVNVARELGGVVAVAGLGALAVARLGTDLRERLLSLGVPQNRVDLIVDALLRGATQAEVLDLAEGRVPFEAVLLLRSAAETSYTGSVQLALGGAALALLLSAVAAPALLPARR